MGEELVESIVQPKIILNVKIDANILYLLSTSLQVAACQ